jgi:hypothetical protein
VLLYVLKATVGIETEILYANHQTIALMPTVANNNNNSSSSSSSSSSSNNNNDDDDEEDDDGDNNKNNKNKNNNNNCDARYSAKLCKYKRLTTPLKTHKICWKTLFSKGYLFRPKICGFLGYVQKYKNV